MPHMETWRDIKLVHRGEEIVIDGVGFSAIGQLAFLQLLQDRVQRAGIAPHYGKQVTSIDELAASIFSDRRRWRELLLAALRVISGRPSLISTTNSSGTARRNPSTR